MSISESKLRESTEFDLRVSQLNMRFEEVLDDNRERDKVIKAKEHEILELQHVVKKLENNLDQTKSKFKIKEENFKQEIADYKQRVRTLKSEIKESDSLCTANSKLHGNVRNLRQKIARLENIIEMKSSDQQTLM